MIIDGAAGAEGAQLAMRCDRVTAGNHCVGLVFGHADEIDEYKRTVPHRAVAHAYVVAPCRYSAHPLYG
jgi:hypothetical protein